jgi:hypothetical protein
MWSWDGSNFGWDSKLGKYGGAVDEYVFLSGNSFPQFFDPVLSFLSDSDTLNLDIVFRDYLMICRDKSHPSRWVYIHWLRKPLKRNSRSTMPTP